MMKIAPLFCMMEVVPFVILHKALYFVLHIENSPRSWIGVVNLHNLITPLSD
jgi:hypothetical protein